MSHGLEFTVVFVVCVVLVAGAATRALARRIRFPYTIAMMLLGLGVGLALSDVHSESEIIHTLALLEAGAYISPNVILFVFLPALVFESAHAVDQHALWKERGAVGILAGPALLLSTIVIGGCTWLMTSWSEWDWSITAALVFGALISATDPVAVVAILREVNAPKRLCVLIEGESLLNDGTAIVVFSVLLGLLTAGGGGGSGFSIGAAVLQFAKVVTGGVAVGLVLGAAFSRWLSRTFNDPVVELSHTVVVAYLAMLIAEGLFHVSGVIAIVVAALWLGGRGRTSTSPEVSHFMHQFWHLLAYIANTLIFFLVGLVAAAQLGHARPSDLLFVLGAYIIVVVVRLALTYGFRPLLALAGSPLSVQEAGIISWGGLRGAVSLALALIVIQNPSVDAELGRQILVTTAGVVLLTVAVNGATAGWVMRQLGLTKRPASERLAQLAVKASALDRVRQKLEDLAIQSGLRALDWTALQRDLAERRADLDRQIDATETELQGASPGDRTVGYWTQALSIERREYWAKFGRGTLNPAALRALLAELERHQDCMAMGDLSPSLPRSEADARNRDSIWHRLIAGIQPLQFRRLSLLYDIARAEAVAAAAVLHSLASLSEADPQVLAEIRSTYERNLRVSKQRVEELRIHVPELVRAIETRLARRIQLNAEREEYQHLIHHGALSEQDGEAAVVEVEEQMKRLAFAPIEFELPSAVALCRASPIFADLDDDAIRELTELAKEHVLAPGEIVVKAGESGDSSFVVARGAAEVIAETDSGEQILDVLGAGEVFGEIALLTGVTRSATVRAATTLTVTEIDRDALSQFMDRHPGMGDHIWRAYARHRFDNHARETPHLAHLDSGQRKAWIAGRDPMELATGAALERTEAAAYLFIVTGEIAVGEAVFSAPALVELARHPGAMAARSDARALFLPHPPA